MFTGFGSYDGTNWTQLGSATISMPSQIYLGLAVASGSGNAGDHGAISSILTTTPAGAAGWLTQVHPNEPLGPSTRKTGIVISEIM